MNQTRIYDMESGDLARHLVGKSITTIDDEAGVITLSDDTRLELEDSADCCAWFEGKLRTIDLTENAITAVREDGHTAECEYDDAWKLTVLSVDKEVCAVEIVGNASSGYYCHSIELVVHSPEK